MQNYNIKDYSVNLIEHATVDWYENMKVGAVIVVTAKVFLAWVRQKQLPSAVTELLKFLERCQKNRPMYAELYPTERGHLYQFNYRVVGCIECSSPT